MAKPKLSPDDDKKVEDNPQEKIESIRRFLGDNTIEAKSSKDEAETPPKEDVSQDEAADKAELEKPEKSVGLSQEDVDEQISKAKTDLLGRIRESFGLTKDDEAELEDKGIVAPWEKENRAPTSYREVAEYSAQLAEYKRQQAEAEQKKIDDVKKQKSDEENKALNAIWDMQLDELRDSGKLPKINPDLVKKMKAGQALTEEERKDPGLEAQAQLFQTMYVVSRDRLANNKPAVTNLKEVFYEYYKPGNRDKVAGADAPVSGASIGANAEEEEPINYKEIHDSDWYDLIGED